MYAFIHRQTYTASIGGSGNFGDKFPTCIRCFGLCMVLLRGSGGMPHRKFLKIACSETDLNGNFTGNLHLKTL